MKNRYIVVFFIRLFLIIIGIIQLLLAVKFQLMGFKSLIGGNEQISAIMTICSYILFMCSFNMFNNVLKIKSWKS